MTQLTEDQARSFMHKLLTAMSQAGGSDLFIANEFPPSMKANGAMQPLTPQKLNADLTRALRSDEVRDKFRAMDFTPLPSTPDEFTAMMRRDSKRWQEAVRLSGFKSAE